MFKPIGGTGSGAWTFKNESGQTLDGQKITEPGNYSITATGRVDSSNFAFRSMCLILNRNRSKN